MLASRLMRSVSEPPSVPEASHEHTLIDEIGYSACDVNLPIISISSTHNISIPERLRGENQRWREGAGPGHRY